MDKKIAPQNDSTTNYVRQFRGIVEFERRLKEIESTYQKMTLDLARLENKINSYI